MLLLPCSLAPWISNLQIHKLSCQRGCRQVPAWCLSSSTKCVDNVRLTYDLGPAAAALRSKEAAKVRLRAALAPCSDTKFPGFCATPLIHLQYMLALSFRSSLNMYINECYTSTLLSIGSTSMLRPCSSVGVAGSLTCSQKEQSHPGSLNSILQEYLFHPISGHPC